MIRKTQKFAFHLKTGGNRKNPAILFLHGFLGSADDWEAVIGNLQEDSFCIAVDLPDHGQTKPFAADASYSIPIVAKEIIVLCQRLHLSKIFLTGYSMGGRIALYLAIHYPEFFQAVIAESASAGLPTAEEREARGFSDEQIASKLENQDFKQFVHDWYAQSLFSSIRENPFFPQLVAKRLKNDPRKLARALRCLSPARQPSLWGKLPDIKIPALFLAGELDEKYCQMNAAMAKLCPKSQLRLAQGLGHNVHFENPKLFVQIIREFFSTWKERSKHECCQLD